MKFTRVFLPCILLITALSSCGQERPDNVIYTSFYPLYYFTKRIVKDKYDVINLTPAGSEPHDYEPTAREVIGMSEAKAVFINGLSLEPWSNNMPEMLKDKVHVTTESITPMKINGVTDPHVWLSLNNAILQLQSITDTMKEIDKANSDFYTRNFNEVKAEFEALDQENREILKNISNPYLVVSHAAFGYLCRDYNLTQVYVSGLAPDEEPTPKDLENIMEEVREYNVTTIFYEELVSPEISKKIAEETGVKTASLNPLEGLTQEEMKTSGYVSVMKDNIQKIKAALQ